MNNHWHNLNDRERWMISIGAVCCFFYFFYAVFYRPLANKVQHRSEQLVEKQVTLTWMRQQEPIAKTTTKLQFLTNSQLLSVLANQLHETSFSQFAAQLQQVSNGDIQLSFEQVPFNPCILWLWSVQQKYAIVVKQLHLEKTSTSGVVKLLVVMATKSSDA